ncbi:hypothetical protein OHA18_18065 [Kribbella sp. NBC_00709]|uniref:hypothetical protein n=1 Tax=Kribbella sp. NBC_00709 TaxID=2975972 RepID=UPI002E29DD78|nr:hypothetical protein [Kribbella sp. NBC_00709]
MEEPGRTARFRILAAAALVLGYSATAACSNAGALPVSPSPGLNSSRPAATTSAVPVGSTPGPGETKPGIQLIVVPQRDGSFDMTENVMLPQATDILPLQLPTSGDHLPGMMSRTTPRVTNLKVVADDQSVPIGNTTVTAAGDLPLTVSATRIQLTYRLSGSTVLASPSASTRASSAVRPLTASAGGTLPTNVTVTSGLLNAICPLLTETRCAVGDPPILGIQPGIPASKALVVLQLDLPR